MLTRLVLALVVAIATFLVIQAIALVLGLLGVEPAEAVAAFLRQWAWVIAILAGIWFFLTGRTALW